MKTPDTPIPPEDVKKKQAAPDGPTAPATADAEKGKGPETGGYDDHAPDRTSNNAKGGYGAG